MIYPKFSDIKQELKDELDLNEETFIQDDEMNHYFDEAVDMVEFQIHTIAEDYFLSRATIPVVAGQSEYQLPSNIYANKIRKLIWSLNNTERYEIYPIKDLMTTEFFDSDDFYRYLFLNNGVTQVNTIGTVIKLYPAARTTSSTALICWYIRNANRYTDEDAVCDIPEWSNVIKQYVRYKCMIKEGHPQSSQSKEDLDRMIAGMNEALRSRAMDENNRLSLDPRVLGEYNDFVNDYWNYWY